MCRDAVVEGEAQAVERTRQAEASAGEARPAKRPGLLASLQGLGRRSRTASAQAQEAQQHGQARSRPASRMTLLACRILHSVPCTV